MTTLINVNTIMSNENNPRKDLGDLTELRDSIKKNGVLQPLTVVPYMDGYKVVIGHRRLEAAKQAEIEEVPCIVENWAKEEQLNVMMMENMLREQLTTYEEAKGFQMMLDLGKSVEQIADETGFSQTTVRNRTKLLTLDEKKFKKSVERGATLQDLVKLYDIEDEHTRNAVLNSAGTKDFESKLQRAVNDEQSAHRMAEAEMSIAQWAKKIDKANFVDGEAVQMRYVGFFGAWTTTIPVREDPEGVYYYTNNGDIIRIYIKGEDTEEAERKAKADEERRIRSELNEVAQSCYNLRLNFVRNFGNFRKHGKYIMTEFMKASMQDMCRSSWRNYDLNDIGNILGVDDLENNLDKLNEFSVEKVALAMLMVYNDKQSACAWDSRWREGTYVYVYTPNEKLTAWYSILVNLGYQISTEEMNMMNGDVDHVVKDEQEAA